MASMAHDWRRFCDRKGYSLENDHVEVSLGDGRRHKVGIREDGQYLLLFATVLRPSAARDINNLALRSWLRNRELQLIGFRIDAKERLIAEARILKEGMSKSEFQLYLETLAIEADSFEYALTGEDRE
jgi:hypothetical protein